MWNPVKAASLLYGSLVALIPTLINTILTNRIYIINWDFYISPSIPISLVLLFDTNGLVLITTVVFIAANVLIFTKIYIEGDSFLPRFVALVISFILAICLLVILPNLITLLIGWDGLGLTSYLLVLYYQTPKSQRAAIITAITNRLGDILIIVLISLRINSHWLPLQPWSSPLHSLIASALIVAAITKRAQFPFIRWLPAAIAAPTPVSALVHSSTLVTAGVFILIRFYPSLVGIPSLSLILLFAAALTCCIAGLAAISECDIKKIIALSTLSQLGTIIYSLAINMPLLTLFHLTTHALFKALLFIAAGTLIHYHRHSQDLRSFGLLRKSIPVTSSIVIRSSIALCGIPFTAGFYSKDLILEAQINNPINFLLIIIFLLATGLTTAYSIRFLINVTWAPRHSLPARIFQALPNITSITPILALARATLFAGASLSWILIIPESEVILPLPLKTQALTATCYGLLFGWLLNKSIFKTSAWLISHPLTNQFLTSLAFTTPLNAQATSYPTLTLGAYLQKNIEGGWVEVRGGQGTLILLETGAPKITLATGKSLISNLISFAAFTLILALLFENSLNIEHYTEDVLVNPVLLKAPAMHLEILLILIIVATLITAAKQRHHILIALLRLEATSLILATLYSFSFSLSTEDFLGILLLTLAAAETASALGLLSTLRRFSGSDKISVCSLQ